MQTKRLGLVRFILLSAISVIPLLSQGDRGVITGTVTDVSGAVVPGTLITAIQKATNTSFKTTTSTTGDFTVPSLPVGEYQVRAEKSGFKTQITENVLIGAGGTVRVDTALQVGQTQQSVEVMASAQLVQTENARVSTSVSSTLVDSLPVQVNGGSRSPFDLASTTAEVNAAGTFRIGGGNNTVGISLDGSSLAGDKIGSDAGNGGAAAMNSPSVEALTEFSVEAGGFKAETGHVSGGTLSFVSKSGTNGFHGSAFEFLRNQDFDARGFFNSAKSVYKQNDFGVTAGGPVYLPKLYNGKNKTFFFFSYEGFRNRVGAGNGSLSSVPPPEFYTGDLHNWVDGNGKLYQIYDPGSQRLVNGSYVRDPFPGNIIPQPKFDPAAVPIAAALLGVIAAVALWALWRATQPADPPLVRLDVDLGEDVSLPASATVFAGSDIAISPDGTRLEYASGAAGLHSRKHPPAVGANDRLVAEAICQADARTECLSTLPRFRL